MEEEQPQPIDYQPQTPPHPLRVPSQPNWAKRIAGTLLILALISGVVLLFTTNTGRRIRGNPRRLYTILHPFIARHPVASPVLFVVVYVVLAMAALPVWPLQAAGGMAFGLFEGVLLSLTGSTIGAVLTVIIARWIAADFVHERVESRMEKLKQLDETLGHNGFLVVMTVRLIHALPFGLCNYALGLTRVSLMDVSLGTLLGGIPAASFYVGMGTPYFGRWRFYAVLAGINLLLLLPLIMRYLRPKWFEKIGVE
jgi:uncharacterized membrane protein YdjX (TVP38/TMEM64 family)